ncbi:peptidase inhibitor family I36 protein [Streptomyces sp. P1-3]|uniref:peptidase inhibitor family I36 protein n=1 Tax=Streptomyces sp. P1-3 TaxID=3421658 RepID=UPI003D369DFF
MKRVTLALCAAVLAGAASTSAYAADIQRGSGIEVCPVDELCLYENWDFNKDTHDARVLSTYKDIAHLDDYNFNDITSTVYNDTGRIVRLYPHYDYEGAPVTLVPGESIDFKDANGNFNDQISSVRFMN